MHTYTCVCTYSTYMLYAYVDTCLHADTLAILENVLEKNFSLKNTYIVHILF